MRFETAPELRQFAESVRAAVGGWEPPREPDFGTWWDEHDPHVAERLAEAGWAELWTDDELLGPVVAGAVELGRALAPLSVLDAATLGGALAVGGHTRHARALGRLAVVRSGTVRIALLGAGEDVATVDGTGTLRVAAADAEPEPDSGQRLRAWSAATLGYLAGLAARSLEETVAYVGSREQFGAPLASLPAMQARLADAAVAVDGLGLVAWEAALPEAPAPPPSLAWACRAAREVTAAAQQAHGGVGFALETGVHRCYRRAKSMQVWADAVRAEVTGAGATRPSR